MWHAVYVKSRHEKKIASLLTDKGIEAYVPLRKTLKQWSDRKKMVEEPVVSCYVFVNVLRNERENVLRTPGVVAFVRHDNKDAIILDTEMDMMKGILGVQDVKVNIENKRFIPGQLCEVVAGPLVGNKVIVYNTKGNDKIGVYMEGLGMGIMVEIEGLCLEPVNQN